MVRIKCTIVDFGKTFHRCCRRTSGNICCGGREEDSSPSFVGLPLSFTVGHPASPAVDRDQTAAGAPAVQYAPFIRLLKAAELMPGNVSRTYVKLERE